MLSLRRAFQWHTSESVPAVDRFHYIRSLLRSKIETKEQKEVYELMNVSEIRQLTTCTEYWWSYVFEEYTTFIPIYSLQWYKTVARDTLSCSQHLFIPTPHTDTVISQT